ncbi:hypothetical protein Tco_0933407 [Tanacetum coccineum]
MEPSGSEPSEARSKDKGNAPVIDVDCENGNQHVDEHIDKHASHRGIHWRILKALGALEVYHGDGKHGMALAAKMIGRVEPFRLTSGGRGRQAQTNAYIILPMKIETSR